ncbi:hypothetical protein PIB30_101703 [Stylosanthes scabra]|uniref:Uncharacterized protein n=1 Tax=Stylosanthes scabra TaxID=79078 RepID=A0ABU6RY10_9FABA|nr:hypothetical protein [Stylosanthes scabra]
MIYNLPIDDVFKEADLVGVKVGCKNRQLSLECPFSRLGQILTLLLKLRHRHFEKPIDLFILFHPKGLKRGHSRLKILLELDDATNLSIRNNPTSISDQVVPLKSGLSFPRGKGH